MTINCSDPTTVNENNDLTCECRDEEGNPQANLTWYKDGVQIDKTSYGKNILTLTNVTKQDSGRYTCKAQSYILTDEESFEVIVRLNCKYEVKVKHSTVYMIPKLSIPLNTDTSSSIWCARKNFRELYLYPIVKEFRLNTIQNKKHDQCK